MLVETIEFRGSRIDLRGVRVLLRPVFRYLGTSRDELDRIKKTRGLSRNPRFHKSDRNSQSTENVGT